MLAWLAGTAAPAVAAKLIVATNGADDSACGTALAPCRTIAQAISKAAAGDTVEVAPGYYSGVTAGCPADCVVWVNKAVTLVSLAGASATLIDATGAGDGIRVDADGAIVGKKGQGFTVARVGGHTGIYVPGSNVTVAGNTVIGADTGINSVGTGEQILFNRVMLSTATGFSLSGEAVTKGNVAIGCPAGFSISNSSSMTMKGELASANTTGFVISDSSGVVITKSAAIGSGQTGVLVDSLFNPTSVSFTSGTILGSGGAGLDILIDDPINGSATVTATKVFWGAATGPGPAPADGVVAPFNQMPTTTPFAKAEIKVKPPAQR